MSNGIFNSFVVFNKKDRDVLISFFSFCFVLFFSIFLTSCKRKTVNTNGGLYYIANKRGGLTADLTRKYINTNITSITFEESIFLDDIDFGFKKINGKDVAIGRKLYMHNNISTQFFSFDRPDLMGEIGACRVLQQTLIEDLTDDGKINGSAKSHCLSQPRRFSKGQMMFKEVSYNDLEDWHGDDFKDALYAFLQSCSAFKGEKLVQSKTFSIGTEADWRQICEIGSLYYKAGFSKNFFERYFSPFQITNINGKDESKFTGYYIWEFPVSLTRSDKYWYPIYAIPPECKANKNRCPSRDEINRGILAGRGLEIGWASNPMDVYFMQVQGSGFGITEEGQAIRFNYAGKNWQKFVPYSEYIKQNRGFCPVKGYYETIDWLNMHPDKALEATSITQSYVFFNRKSGLEPVVGSQGTPLVQSRSIAIDPAYIPYGVPMWIQTHLAIIDIDNRDNDKWVDWNRLYIAQDTGSAIKGVVRADLYMGHGKKGEFIAKNQNFQGTWYMLIPNSLVNRMN